MTHKHTMAGYEGKKICQCGHTESSHLRADQIDTGSYRRIGCQYCGCGRFQNPRRIEVVTE